MDYDTLIKLLEQIDRNSVKVLTDAQITKLTDELQVAYIFVRHERDARAEAER